MDLYNATVPQVTFCSCIVSTTAASKLKSYIYIYVYILYFLQRGVNGQKNNVTDSLHITDKTNGRLLRKITWADVFE